MFVLHGNFLSNKSEQTLFHLRYVVLQSLNKVESHL